MSALAIEHMSWDEKLRTMEELWASLAQKILRSALADLDRGRISYARQSKEICDYLLRGDRGTRF